MLRIANPSVADQHGPKPIAENQAADGQGSKNQGTGNVTESHSIDRAAINRAAINRASVACRDRSIYSGWLPSVRWAGGYLWLPLKTSSIVAICDAMAGNAHALTAMAKCMRQDPSLVLATLLYQVADSKNPEFDRSRPYSLGDLADAWHRYGCDWWQRTDWLACPDAGASAMRFARFAELENYFRTLPIRRWARHASLWATVSLDTSIDQDSEAGFLSVDRTFDGPVTFNSFSLDLPSPDPSSPDPSSLDLSSLDLSGVELSVGSEDASAGDFPSPGNAHRMIGQWVDGLRNEDRRSSQLACSTDRIRRDLAHSLAYGLSHEINNPLANISTRAQTLAGTVDDPSQRQSLLRIVDQTSRAHAMIADLMFYAKPRNADQKLFDLRECLDRLLQGFAESTQRLSISLQWRIDDRGRSTMAMGDEEMIAEAVAELVQNSVDAIGTGGQIQVRATSIEPGESEHGRWAIDVCDSGPGLTPEQASKAFDPYFSGREAGRGLGLGLCRAARIAQLHGGTVTIPPSIAGCVATLQW